MEVRRGRVGSAARLAGAACALTLVAGATATTDARVYLSADQALELAFGEGAKVEREVFFLTESQLARARSLAGPRVEVSSALATRYRGSREETPLGWAYFDTHRVRTLQETVMIVVGPDAKVSRVEILSFLEPEEYLPRRGWLDQFLGRALGRGLSVARDIHGITGATLSSHAVTDAARRVLAVHQVLAASPAAADPSRGDP